MNAHPLILTGISISCWATVSVTQAQSPLSGLLGNDSELVTSDEVQAEQSDSEAKFQAALAAENGGNSRQARDLYKSIVKSYPRTLAAAKAQFRYAVLMETSGDERKAFDAYEELIKNFRNTPDFEEAIERQYGIAEHLMKNRKEGIMGFGATIQPSKLTAMFQLIADAAAYTDYAPKSLLNIGAIQLEAEDQAAALAAYQKILNAYPGTSHAAEAQYRIFQIRGEAAADSESPNADRAQAEAGLDFVAQNPDDARAAEIRQHLNEIEVRSMEKTYNTGRFYEKSGKPVSARRYYEEVVKNPNTPWAAKAQARLNILDNVATESPSRSGGGISLNPFKRKKEATPSQPEIIALPAEEPES